jgi:energy-coupling factor transport system substrate-specific component
MAHLSPEFPNIPVSSGKQPGAMAGSPPLFYREMNMDIMHELAAVWMDRKGLKWIAVSAILYALVLIPFNHLQWNVGGIPVRPAAALPVVFGILWGPAAAWGLGIGNIAGDIFGSWSLMSMVGFSINFLYPYLSYLFWHRLVGGRKESADRYSLACFIGVTIGATLACMALLAACGTVFFSRPFESKFIGYFANSIFWAVTAGPVLFWFSLEKAVRNGLVYGTEWNEKELSRAA